MSPEQLGELKALGEAYRQALEFRRDEIVLAELGGELEELLTRAQRLRESLTLAVILAGVGPITTH